MNGCMGEWVKYRQARKNFTKMYVDVMNSVWLIILKNVLCK